MIGVAAILNKENKDSELYQVSNQVTLDIVRDPALIHSFKKEKETN